ncbi:MAG: hypothetical protein ACXVCP_03850 [Bdellovibrio sp.]
MSQSSKAHYFMLTVVAPLVFLACAKQPKVDSLSYASVGFNHSSTITSCAVCHSNDKDLSASLGTIVNQFNHKISNLPDCRECHMDNAITKNWTSWNIENISNGTNVSINQLGIAHTNLKTPQTCISCHINERPSGPIGTTNYDHEAKGAIGDCISCHGSDPAKIGISWGIF